MRAAAVHRVRAERPGRASPRPAPAAEARQRQPGPAPGELTTARGLPLRRALAVGASDDSVERDADRVADAVLRRCPCGGPAGQDGECAACGQERLRLSRATAPGPAAAAAAPPIVDRALAAPGRPLDARTREYFEPRLGADLAAVRVHDDAVAAASADAVNANAYTVGDQIVFAAGRHDPGTPTGDRLLAHELAHVLQGAGGGALRRSATVTATGFTVKSTPTTSMTVVPFVTGNWSINMTTDAPGFVLDSSVDVACSGGGAAGYEVGIIQVETSETSRATYFGLTPADGSLVASKSQARKPKGSCLDTRTGRFWTADATGEKSLKPPSCGANALPTFSDLPSDSYWGRMENALTHKPNYIRDVSMAMAFTDALAVKAPGGAITVLKWLRWGANWDAKYTSTATGSTPNGPTTGSGYWLFGDDAVRPPEIPATYAPAAQPCVDIAAATTSGDYVVETNASY